MSLHALLDPAQVAAIKDAPLFNGERHPLWGALFDEKASSTDFITRRAADAVWKSPSLQQGMQNTLRRSTNMENISDAAAAVAELRAFGSMLEAGMNPKPLPAGGKRGSTPDFEADTDGDTVTIEVHAKHEDGAQTARRKAMLAGEDVPGVERSSTKIGDYLFTTRVSVWHPGGAPNPMKPNDSVQTNLISKLCAVKGKERQRRDGVPAVLWLDLNTFDPMSENLIDQTEPLESYPLGLVSGAIWHAFYGWKGAPIFEDWHQRTFTMQHDGRFRRGGATKSGLAAAIICFERGLVLYENPSALVPLPASFRHRCLRLPWFKIAPSVVDWVEGSAAGHISLAEAQIKALAEGRRALAD